MGRLDGKVAIITGAGSGIGQAAAVVFAREGARVVVADLVYEGGEKTAKEIGEAGGEAHFVKTDVSKSEDVKNLVKKTVDIYGRLDVIFNNAGIAVEEGSTIDCSEEVFENILATNLKGVWLGMKYAIPEMLKTGGGSIINMGSIAAARGVPNEPAYSASKGGVVALSRATAVEFASRNIRVNCINPGIVSTPMIMAQPSKSRENYRDGIPAGRFGSPEEIAKVALFLASDESSYVNGHALAADAGIEANANMNRVVGSSL